jgi:hypothetical protein
VVPFWKASIYPTFLQGESVDPDEPITERDDNDPAEKAYLEDREKMLLRKEFDAVLKEKEERELDDVELRRREFEEALMLMEVHWPGTRRYLREWKGMAPQNSS